MNTTLRNQLISSVMGIIGTILTARGIITADQASDLTSNILIISGPLITVASIIYTSVTHTVTAQIENTAKLSQVKRIVTTDQAMALKIARPDVVHVDKI